jgi:hypothetical protein
MMPTTSELGWSLELEMYAGTAACVLVIILIVGGGVLLVKFLLQRGRHHWPEPL